MLLNDDLLRSGKGLCSDGSCRVSGFADGTPITTAQQPYVFELHQDASNALSFADEGGIIVLIAGEDSSILCDLVLGVEHHDALLLRNVGKRLRTLLDEAPGYSSTATLRPHVVELSFAGRRIALISIRPELGCKLLRLPFHGGALDRNQFATFAYDSSATRYRAVVLIEQPKLTDLEQKVRSMTFPPVDGIWFGLMLDDDWAGALQAVGEGLAGAAEAGGEGDDDGDFQKEPTFSEIAAVIRAGSDLAEASISELIAARSIELVRK